MATSLLNTDQKEPRYVNNQHVKISLIFQVVFIIESESVAIFTEVVLIFVPHSSSILASVRTCLRETVLRRDELGTS